MKNSSYVDKAILDLSSPGLTYSVLFRELALYGNLLELSLRESDDSHQKTEFYIANESGEYFMKEEDDKFTALLENKLNRNYPSIC